MNMKNLKEKAVKNKKRIPDFKALALKITEDAENAHTTFFKEHAVREQSNEKPSGRTIFAVNIPPYADEQGIKNAFREAGIVKSVIFALKPSATEQTVQKFLPEICKPSFRIAYIVFDKVSELDKALKLTHLQPMNSADHQIKLGMEKWIEEYNNSILQPKVLRETIEKFMKTFDSKTKKADEKEKLMEQEDDEGWMTVTKRGKVQSFARTEKVENKIMAKEQQKKKRKELQNFYTFQIRESKMKNIVALRQKFEEDKKKIAQIKQSRRFKPF